MTPTQITKFLDDHALKRDRTIVIIDFSNVDKWRTSLGWIVGVNQLSNLVKHLSGKQPLRRFYYGSDFGPSEKSTVLRVWSQTMLNLAKYSNLQVVTKRVKYIHKDDGTSDLVAKCDLDVEMTVDMIKERDNYDTIILFSGDGDLSYALKYLHETYGKECMVFGARNHIAAEMIDALNNGIISHLFFAEDFEYRLKLPPKHR